MKIIKNNISKNGSIVVEAEEDEDMYHLYNLIRVGDAVESVTVRNVILDKKANVKGSKEKTRMHLKIEIRVENIEFDAEQCSLRLKGRNMSENEYIKMGQYHTVELELGQVFTVTKEAWDNLYLSRIEEASNPTRKADIAAIALEEGVATVCLIKSELTKICASIVRSIPKKKQGNNQQYDKAITKFYEDIYIAIKKNINFDYVKVILIGSPNTYKNEFLETFHTIATKEGEIALLRNKSKFVMATVSSGTKNAIDEMLKNEELFSRLVNVKAVAEVQALQQFSRLLDTEPDKVCYGYDHVYAAYEAMAIESLLISDKLYRSDDFELRNKYVALIDAVKNNNGIVHMFSSMHSSGAQLDMYTGIAATLRYPINDELLDGIKEG